MDELTMLKACADAMGLRLLRAYPRVDLRYSGDGWNGLMYSTSPHPCLFIDSGAYDPLHDDAQCFALVKKFHIIIDYFTNSAGEFSNWTARTERSNECASPSLNRAIVECIAKKQAGSL